MQWNAYKWRDKLVVTNAPTHPPIHPPTHPLTHPCTERDARYARWKGAVKRSMHWQQTSGPATRIKNYSLTVSSSTAPSVPQLILQSPHTDTSTCTQCWNANYSNNIACCENFSHGGGSGSRTHARFAEMKTAACTGPPTHPLTHPCTQSVIPTMPGGRRHGILWSCDRQSSYSLELVPRLLQGRSLGTRLSSYMYAHRSSGNETCWNVFCTCALQLCGRKWSHFLLQPPFLPTLFLAASPFHQKKLQLRWR